MNGQLSVTFKVGKRYRCSIALPVDSLTSGTAQIQIRWEPEPPTRLTKSELRDYRRGRDTLLAEAARLLGGTVLVAEL